MSQICAHLRSTAFDPPEAHMPSRLRLSAKERDAAIAARAASSEYVGGTGTHVPCKTRRNRGWGARIRTWSCASKVHRASQLHHSPAPLAKVPAAPAGWPVQLAQLSGPF